MILDYRVEQLKSYASNEIRYRGFYASRIQDIAIGYNLTEEEARYVRQLINDCTFVFGGEEFTG